MISKEKWYRLSRWKVYLWTDLCQTKVTYCAFRNSCLFIYSNSIYKHGQDYLEILYYMIGKSLLIKLAYCMSQKSWPILYCNLLYKMGQDFLDIQYSANSSCPVCTSLNVFIKMVTQTCCTRIKKKTDLWLLSI